MLRIRRTIVSLVIVCVLYSGYTLAVVPWIEPLYISKHVENAKAAQFADEPRDREWMKLFPAEAWELSEETKSLESDDGILLFKEYSRDGKGRWELTPATLIYYTAASKGKKKRPFVIRPRRAVLQFDGPLNLISGGRGKLVGGRLVGDLIITSPESAPGVGDDVELRTRNVEIEAKRIWTPHDVGFRFGDHVGKGRNLTIRLQPASSSQNEGLSFGRLRSIELTQLDQMTVVTENGIIPAAKQPGQRRSTSTDNKPKIPVHVRCKGPFFFDVATSAASLIKNVHLAREYAPNSYDNLHCNRLTIYFVSQQTAQTSLRLAKKSKTKKKKTPARWDVDRIVAVGSPVRLVAPSFAANFTGERLEYHPRDKQIYLSDKELVRLQYGQHYCEAPQIVYQTKDFNRLGTLRAIGPGVFRSSGPELKVAIHAKWKQEVTLRPHRNNHVLSVHKHADVTLDNVNHVTAQQLHVWLREVPRRTPITKPLTTAKKPKEKFDIVIDRFLAVGGVDLTSPQLIANTEQLEGWVRHDLAVSARVQRDPPANKRRSTFGAPPTRREKRKSKWRADASLVRVQLAQSQHEGKRTVKLDSLVLRGSDQKKVILQEVVAPKPTDEKVYLEGDWLRMLDGLTTNPQFIVSANREDAIIKARGVHLFGRRIDLQQGRNKMWIDGPGTLSAAVSSDLHGNKLKQPKRMTVQWDRRMDFDGLQATFSDSVLVSGPQQVIRGKKLTVSLNQRVDFSQKVDFDGLKVRRANHANSELGRSPRKPKPEIQHLRFYGQVFAESHSFDDKKQLESVEQIWVSDLELHRDTGKISGKGPGRLIRRNRDSGKKRNSTTNLFASKSGKRAKLHYLQVDFRSHLGGNLHARRVTLYEQIEALYGPIPNWKSSLHNRTPEGLGERGVEITSRTLTVSEWKKMAGQKRGPLEVTAAGNTRVRGSNFAAHAERLSYVEAKDLVVLESATNDKAKIRHWSSNGNGDVRQISGRKILFWPRRGEWKLENLGSFTLEGPGTFKPKLPK